MAVGDKPAANSSLTVSRVNERRRVHLGDEHECHVVVSSAGVFQVLLFRAVCHAALTVGIAPRRNPRKSVTVTMP